MGKSKLCIMVKRDPEDLTLIRLGNAVEDEVESTHDFLVLPAYYECLVWVEDENGNKLVDSEYHNLSPNYEISRFVDAFHDNENELEDDELEELQNFWNNLKFDDASALLYKPAWEQLKDADADEETFIFNLLKGSVKGMETCAAEVGDCCDYYKFTVEYDIEIPDGEEFDIEKLDFFCVDVEDLACWEELSNVFNRNVLFLDTIIYDGKVYTGTTGLQEDGSQEKIIPNSCGIEHLVVETLETID